MAGLEHLFESNRRWAQAVEAQDPGFFRRLAGVQRPDYLWIGCADSRVPANEIVGLLPGEMFVHRNVANVVVHTDLNCLSVVQYAVAALGIRHIIVCGHYGCGGVKASLDGESHGLIDNWLRHVEDVRLAHEHQLRDVDRARWPDVLCELNVVEQVLNVSRTTVVADAWRQGRDLTVHGWVYGLHDGLIRDLGVSLSGAIDPAAVAEAATTRVFDRARQ